MGNTWTTPLCLTMEHWITQAWNPVIVITCKKYSAILFFKPLNHHWINHQHLFDYFLNTVKPSDCYKRLCSTISWVETQNRAPDTTQFLLQGKPAAALQGITWIHHFYKFVDFSAEILSVSQLMYPNKLLYCAVWNQTVTPVAQQDFSLRITKYALPTNNFSS